MCDLVDFVHVDEKVHKLFLEVFESLLLLLLRRRRLLLLLHSHFQPVAR